ncbi:RNA-guided endonuclease InsQ/TnpB family protein [Saccharopolyspora sp. NPDC002376]
MKRAYKYRDGQLTLAKMREPLNIVWSRPLPQGAEPTTVTVSRDNADRWFVPMLVETTVDHRPASDQAVGVDAGITSLVTLSTGEKITNPKHSDRERVRLAKAQRALARKEKGSNNRDKARLKVARIQAKIADRRRDHLHEVTTRLVRDNQTVVIEDLNVRGMVRNRNLSRAISDAS